MKKLLLSSILAMGLVLVSFAQETATTQSGKSVLLYEDGTWKVSNTTANFNQRDKNSCKSLIKSKINLASKSLSFHSVRQTSGEENQFTYQWFFDKNKGVSLELMLNETCVRFGDYVKLRFGEYNQFLQLQNKEKSNCGGKMLFSFTGNDKTLQAISKKQIQSIEIDTKDGKVKEEIEGATFSKSCACIAKISANYK